jgi:hypothetical protein
MLTYGLKGTTERSVSSEPDRPFWFARTLTAEANRPIDPIFYRQGEPKIVLGC